MNDKVENREMSFIAHLEELRWILIKIFIVWIVVCTAVFIMKDFFFDTIILGPNNPNFITNRVFGKIASYFGIEALRLNSQPIKLISIKLGGQFYMHMFLSFIIGLIIVMPYILWEIWRYVSPALYDKEKSNVKGLVGISSFLFFVGVLFGYFIIAPVAISFLGNYQVSPSIENTVSINSYTDVLSLIVICMGITFELPLILFYLTKFGILNVDTLRKKRKIIVVILLVAAGILTPTPDIFSQIIVFFPLWALFEISIILSMRHRKKHNTLLTEE